MGGGVNTEVRLQTIQIRGFVALALSCCKYDGLELSWLPEQSDCAD